MEKEDEKQQTCGMAEVDSGLPAWVDDKVKKVVSGLSSKHFGKMEASEIQIYPGLEVAIAHKLAPRKMKLTIATDDEKAFMGFGDLDKGYKYVFYYKYLDLTFSIKTDDDKTAAKLYPYFSEEQKTAIMSMTLGSKAEE